MQTATPPIKRAFFPWKSVKICASVRLRRIFFDVFALELTSIILAHVGKDNTFGYSKLLNSLS